MIAFAAVILINLADVNVLPLSALDSGKRVFVLEEAAIRRKVYQSVQESINSAVLLFYWL